jgi:hypothetical protein
MAERNMELWKGMQENMLRSFGAGARSKDRDGGD